MSFSAERIAELGKLLKGKIRADWSLFDEAYRELFDELMALLSHRESVVVAFMMHQATKRRVPRERNGDRVDAAEAQAVQ